MKESILADIINSNISKKDNFFTNKMALEIEDFEFFHIEEITFEDNSPPKEALENVISSLRIDNINFVYLIVGSKSRISFYFGVAKESRELDIDIDDIANQILKSNIEGNFRGSRLHRLKRSQKQSIQKSISEYKYIVEVDGVPNINEEAKGFQGVDRLVDIMLKDEFSLMIVANSLKSTDIEKIEKELFRIYDKLTPLVKKSIQYIKSQTTQDSDSNSRSNSTANQNSQTNSSSDTKSIVKSNSISTSFSKSTTDSNSSRQKSDSSNENSSDSSSTNKSNSDSSSKTNTNSKNNTTTTAHTNSTQNMENETINIEFERKELEEWLRYIDEVLLKRINYAKGKGAFLNGVYLFANTKGKITKLANSFISLFSGVEQNKVPLSYEYITNSTHKNYIYNFQLPKYNLNLNLNQTQKMFLYSKQNGIDWFSTKELSVIASLPQKEVVGLRLKEEVEFGLNVDKIEGDRLSLGKLISSGSELDIDVDLSISELNKHIFITGVTGSGKTTTCHKILHEAKLPFLVIEPAKTEYRSLANLDGVIVFTLGIEGVAPFRINPFEFQEGENISSRVDMIKATIESSFDMEAAIPQIIESAIYRAYEKYGWDIATNKNWNFKEPFAKGVKSFPMLEDIISMVKDVVDEQGFDDRLKNDYIGSINARLQGFMIGNKRYMLNTPRGFDFKNLLEKRVIIELEEIKNPSEKSFIMGLILINLNEAIKQKYREYKAQNREFRHITLLEEAHRLLSKYEYGDSLNKKRGVEAFSDMLAEIRKYGESLIIVDQIPNKLTPEVLKNTNTKIVHRIFASDDKEAIGNTMALKDEQKEFLSKLDIGKAIVFNQSFYNAIQIKVIKNDIIVDDDISQKVLRDKWLRFYQNELGLNIDIKEIESFIAIENSWQNLIDSEITDSNLLKREMKILHNILKVVDIDLELLSDFITKRFYIDKEPNKIKEFLIATKKDAIVGLVIKNIRR